MYNVIFKKYTFLYLKKTKNDFTFGSIFHTFLTFWSWNNSLRQPQDITEQQPSAYLKCSLTSTQKKEKKNIFST